MPRTFIITGSGRSGTKFLARELNLSKRYEVYHEPNTNIIDASERFSGLNYYGEVNSFLLTHLLAIPVSRRLVIIRNPYDLFKSYLRKGHGPEIQSYVLTAICLLDAYIKCGIRFVRFSEMTSDREVLLRIARYVGIRDLSVKDFCLTPENVVEGDVDEDYKSLLVPYVDKEFGLFVARYGLAQ